MARVWSCALLLVAALVCRPVTGHNNPTVWTGECDPAANQNKGAWSLVAGVNVTGAGFPFVNITGSCFGSESHLLDPESTILVIENVDANDFKIERVTPTQIDLVLAAEGAWSEFADPMAGEHNPLRVLDLKFDGFTSNQFSVTTVALIYPETIFYILPRPAERINRFANNLVLFGNAFVPAYWFEDPEVAATWVPLELELSGNLVQNHDFLLDGVENNRAVLRLLPGRSWGNASLLSVTRARHGGLRTSEWQGIHQTVAAITELEIGVIPSESPLAMLTPRFSIHGDNFGSRPDMIKLHFKNSDWWYSDASQTSQGCVSSGHRLPDGSLSGSDLFSHGVLGGYLTNCTSSPVLSGAHGCDKALDGDDSTDWVSASEQSYTDQPHNVGAWMRVAFSERVTVSGIKYQQRSAHGQNRELELMFQDGSVLSVLLRRSTRLEPYYFFARQTSWVELRVKKTFGRFDQNGASTIEFVLCDVSRAKERQRPFLAPRYASDALLGGRHYTIPRVNNTVIDLELKPGFTWSPGGVVHPLALVAIEVNDTGVVNVSATVARILPNTTVFARSWLMRSSAQTLEIYGRNFDTNISTFGIGLSSGLQLGAGLVVDSISKSRVQLSLANGSSWWGPGCFRSNISKVCLLKVASVSGFGGTMFFPERDQREVAVLFEARMFVARESGPPLTGSFSPLLFMHPDALLGSETLSPPDFAVFPEDDGLVNPAGVAIDHSQQQLFVVAEESATVQDARDPSIMRNVSTRQARLGCFDISGPSPSLVFAKNLGPPLLSVPRDVALEHRRVCAVNVTVAVHLADVPDLDQDDLLGRLRADAARAMQISLFQIESPVVLHEHAVTNSLDQKVDLQFSITTLAPADEFRALANLQRDMRSPEGWLGAFGTVTTNNTVAPDFEARCALKNEIKNLYISSSTSGCVQKFAVLGPAAAATAEALPSLPVHRNPSLRQVCNATLGHCYPSSLGRPVVNINKVSAADFFANFKPFGVSLAESQALVNWRNIHGKFQRVDDLKARDREGLVTILIDKEFEAIKHYLSVHDPRRCAVDAHCAAWDEQACFSETSSLQESSRATGIALGSADPTHVYVTSEAHGLVNQFTLTNGSLRSWTPVLGSHATAAELDTVEADLGPCIFAQQSAEVGTCSTKLDGLALIGTTLYPQEKVLCKQDAHCRVMVPQVIAAVERAGSAPLLFRSSHGVFAWTELFKNDRANGPLLVQANMPVCTTVGGCGLVEQGELLTFNGHDGPVVGAFLEDLERSSGVVSIHVHHELGVLVADSRYVVRYDRQTGERLGVLLDMGEDGVLADFGII